MKPDTGEFGIDLISVKYVDITNINCRCLDKIFDEFTAALSDERLMNKIKLLENADDSESREWVNSIIGNANSTNDNDAKDDIPITTDNSTSQPKADLFNGQNYKRKRKSGNNMLAQLNRISALGGFRGSKYNLKVKKIVKNDGKDKRLQTLTTNNAIAKIRELEKTADKDLSTRNPSALVDQLITFHVSADDLLSNIDLYDELTNNTQGILKDEDILRCIVQSLVCFILFYV